MSKYHLTGDTDNQTLTQGAITDGEFLKRVGNEIVSAAGTGGVAWGAITGTLSLQTDLQTALDGKQAAGSYASAAQGALADTALQSIAAGSITLAKQADVATSTVFYRKTAATGVPEVNTLATLKTDLGLTSTNSGDQTITLTGNVTGTGTGSFAATIAADVVTDAMRLQTSAATSATTGTMTVNMTSDIVTITPTGACTFNASGGHIGRIVTFHITTSGTTSFILTFGTNFRKAGTLATGTTSARFFSVTFRCLSGNTTWTEIARTAVQT